MKRPKSALTKQGLIPLPQISVFGIQTLRHSPREGADKSPHHKRARQNVVSPHWEANKGSPVLSLIREFYHCLFLQLLCEEEEREHDWSKAA